MSKLMAAKQAIGVVEEPETKQAPPVTLPSKRRGPSMKEQLSECCVATRAKAQTGWRKTAPVRLACVRLVQFIEDLMEKGGCPVRKTWGALAMITCILSFIPFLIAVAAPGVLESNMEEELRDRSLSGRISHGNGHHPDSNYGQTYSYKVPYYTDPDAVLAGTARVAEVAGPFDFTVMEHFEFVGEGEAFLGNDESDGTGVGLSTSYVEQTYGYHTRRTRTGGSNLPTEEITVVNPAYRAIEGVMRRNPSVQEFEDGAIPMFAAMALKQIADYGDWALKTAAFPVIIKDWHEKYSDRIYDGDREAPLNLWRQAEAGLLPMIDDARQKSENARSILFDGHAFLLENARVNGAGFLEMDVTRALWQDTGVLAFKTVAGWTRWANCGKLFDPDMTTMEDQNQHVQDLYALFQQEMQHLDDRYNSTITSNAYTFYVRVHVGQILEWVQRFDLDGMIAENQRAYHLQDKIAQLLEDHDFIPTGLLPEDRWPHVMPAQLGGNAVTGSVMMALEARTADSMFGAAHNFAPYASTVVGRYDANNEAAGYTLWNSCPPRIDSFGRPSHDTGGSLTDYHFPLRTMEYHPTYAIHTEIEASCILSRYQEVATDGSGDVVGVSNFQSKFHASQMKHILEAFSVGIEPHLPVVLNGTAAIMTFQNAVKQLFNDADQYALLRQSMDWNSNVTWEEQCGADCYPRAYVGTVEPRNYTGHAVALMRAWNAKEALDAATVDSAEYDAAYQSQLEAIDAYDAAAMDDTIMRVEDGECFNYLLEQGLTELDGMQPELSCHQVYDLYVWLDFLAREYMLSSQYVHKPASGKTPDPTVVRGGHFIKTTAQEYLVDGLADTLYEEITGVRYPGAAPRDDSDRAAFLARLEAEHTQPDYVLMGLQDKSTVDQMWLRNGSRPINIWGEATYPSGSRSGLITTPQLNRHPDASATPPVTMRVYLESAEREVRYSFAGRSTDASGHLTLWDYRFDGDTQTEFPHYVVDERQAAPQCLVSIFTKSSLVDGAPEGNMDILVGRPFLAGCDDSYRSAYGHTYTGEDPTDTHAYSSYVAIDPLLGQAMNARHEWGMHLRYNPSRWYQRIESSVALMYGESRKKVVPAADGEEFANWVAATNKLIDTTIPTVGFSFAAVFGVSFLFTYINYRRRKRYEIQRIRPPRVRDYSEEKKQRIAEMKRVRQSLIMQATGKHASKADRRSILLRKKMEVGTRGTAKVAPEPGYDEIVEELARLKRQKELLEQAAKDGKVWARNMVGTQRPGTAGT